jgi:pullulanase-type alpha-1,6-glucosidase
MINKPIFFLAAAALAVAGLFATVPQRMATAQQGEKAKSVTIPGTLQKPLGCADDWQPTCKNTQLTYDTGADVWSGTFDMPAGSYEYKVAINGAWDENYGGKADRNGANVKLVLDKPQKVTFVYDHKSHLVVNSKDGLIPTLVGSLQSEAGCAKDDAIDCFAPLLLDPEFDGSYGISLKNLPPGDYTFQVALNGDKERVYGQGGIGGKPFKLSVTDAKTPVFIGITAGALEKGDVLISTEGSPKGNISKASAHWISRDKLAWNVSPRDGWSFELYVAPAGGLSLTPKGIQGGRMIALSVAKDGAGDRFPHLSRYAIFQLPASERATVPDLLRGQLALLARDDKGAVVDTTGIQIAGALDDVYAKAAASAQLGVTWQNRRPSVAVWAPTARAVTLLLYKNQTDAPQRVAMTRDAASGVWRATGAASWNRQWYRFEVDVFVRSAGGFLKNEATDPYSISVSTNGRFSQIVDMNDKALIPDGWARAKKPPFNGPQDAVIYELHVRDFSVFDDSVEPKFRGKFGAFVNPDTNGMKHLRALAGAGVSHLHLLPIFDFATVEEDGTKRKEIDRAALAKLPPDSDQQAAMLEKTQGADGFNWGYDPHHFNVPEGSYSTSPDGPARIAEFRYAVMGINNAGLRAVVDVVYNHTNASGQSDRSTFDKIVPGYYHRLNMEGEVEKSTCCENTAAEHAMFEKFMIDSVVFWARQYRVDGFRFDLMGHHMASNMRAIRAALDALTVAKDGVDGRSIILYGEGWNFGEVANNARGVNATQVNMAGTGIATFNDRLRDAVRGGGPFGDQREAGFGSGLYFSANGYNGSSETQKDKLLLTADKVRLGLAGTLRDYPITTLFGKKTGAQVDYNGSPAGYAANPLDVINYVSKHDNETLFDKVNYAAADNATMQQRVRMALLAQSTVLFAQGIPFIHAGDDMLRSKSLERDSYNSSDWFNALDWTYTDNGWGRGLPPNSKDKWPVLKALLARADLKPAPADIAYSRDVFRELVQIRKSSALFRLKTGAEVNQRVSFLNTGVDQVPGLIVMVIDGAGSGDAFKRVVVVFNSSPLQASLTDGALKGLGLTLHPVQLASVDKTLATAKYDAAAGTVSVPPFSTTVWVE